MNIPDRSIEVCGSALIIGCPDEKTAREWAAIIAKLPAHKRLPASRYAWDRDMWPKDD